MTPLDRFTQDDLIAQLGMETVAKGLGYLSRVSALSCDGSAVSALVKGRQRTPYDVVADVTAIQDLVVRVVVPLASAAVVVVATTIAI